MIFKHVFHFKNPISFCDSYTISFIRCHTHHCKINNHRIEEGGFICTNPFDPDDSVFYEAPPTIFEILLTSKAIRKEALSAFFAVNSVLFTSFWEIRHCQTRMNRRRFQLLQDVTIVWEGAGVIGGVKTLCRLPLLQKLSVIIDFGRYRLVSDDSLKNVEGIPELSRMRGLSELKMAGRDRVRRYDIVEDYGISDSIWNDVEEGDDPEWKAVSVWHPRAVGPWLRDLVTQPKPATYEADMARLFGTA
ncbi:MAG: hypothetical protein Q9225_008108 [Loekoesia sp. 1 TL-2023]